MCSFELKGKVALVTGGASGMGYEYSLALLEKGVKGVTIADVSEEAGNKAFEDLGKKFDQERILFVQTDTSKYEEFENAFKRTIEKFKNVDLLINNAGIFDEAHWHREVQINVIGTINGMLLGLDHYLPKHKSGEEAVILNVSSIACLEAHAFAPIYGSTKFSIFGMTISWGMHFERTKVRVVGLCPGGTRTPLFNNVILRLLPGYDRVLLDDLPRGPLQDPDIVGRLAVDVIERAPAGTLWVVEGGEPPYQYEMPDRNKIKKKYLELKSKL